MATKKQIKANRNNGKKGGVKTEEGKKISSMNAVKHAFRTADVVLPWESRDEYNRHCKAILQSIQPFCALSYKLSLKVSENLWRIDRGGGAEKRAYIKATCREQLLKELAEISRYESRLMRDNDRALNQIMKLMKLKAQRIKLGLPDMEDFEYPVPEPENKKEGWQCNDDMPYDAEEGQYWRAHLDDVALGNMDRRPTPYEEESVRRRSGFNNYRPDPSAYRGPSHEIPPSQQLAPHVKDISSFIMFETEEEPKKDKNKEQKGGSKKGSKKQAESGKEAELGSFVKKPHETSLTDPDNTQSPSKNEGNPPDRSE